MTNANGNFRVGGDTSRTLRSWVISCPLLCCSIESRRAEGDKPRVENKAVTRDEAWKLANHWIAAWNAHDLDLIMSHYEDAIQLTSPAAAQLLSTPNGTVAGKSNLRAYFQRGLETYPELNFDLEDVLWGVNSVVLYYKNQKGTRTGEFMELSAIGKVVKVIAHYSA
jgi:predicted ester cyclase